MDVRFQDAHPEGECLIGGQVLRATIDNASAFAVDGGTSQPPGFARFPSSFVPAFSARTEATPGGAAPFPGRYKTILFGAALVLLVVLLVWLYPWVVRRELDPAG